MELGYKTLNQSPEVTSMDMLRGVFTVAIVAAVLLAIGGGIYHAVRIVVSLVQIIGQVIG